MAIEAMFLALTFATLLLYLLFYTLNRKWPGAFVFAAAGFCSVLGRTMLVAALSVIVARSVVNAPPNLLNSYSGMVYLLMSSVLGLLLLQSSVWLLFLVYWDAWGSAGRVVEPPPAKHDYAK